MISLKAAAAVTLTGLGASTLGVDGYLLSNHHRIESNAPAEGFLPPVRIAVPDKSTSVEVETPALLVLEPVLIRARVRHRAAPEAPAALVPCSDWQSLASGPAARHVQRLCTPASPQHE